MMYKERGLRLVSFVLCFCVLFSGMVIPVKAASGQMITISTDGQVVDTFNGVSSLYRPGDWDGKDSTYGCHAYVIRYYQAVYGKTVYNLFHAQTPMTEGDSFVQVTTPQPGDICAQIKSTSNHWSIVKSVSGTTVNVIDQNNKWVANGVTYAYKDFSYDVSEVVFYRLASVPSDTTVTETATTTQETVVEPISSVSINIGEDMQITSDEIPALEGQDSVRWESSDASVASVTEDGYIIGVNKGTATVTVSLSDGQAFSLKVTVKVPAKKLKLVSKDVTIPKSYQWKLTAKVTPSNSTDKVSYSSSNKKVATVSKKGLVKSKKKRGKTTITVKTSSGKKKKCIVRVY